MIRQTKLHDDVGASEKEPTRRKPGRRKPGRRKPGRRKPGRRKRKLMSHQRKLRERCGRVF
jgi:hypothetical protein